VWPFLKITLWVLFFWLVARLAGFPIEKLVRKTFAGMSGFR
jgi:hypothetical protein